MVETLVGRALDVDLTASGRAQLPALVERLRPACLAAIYCSPRRRTHETAQAIAMDSGVQLVVEPALDEVDFGTWSGCTFAQLQSDPKWHRWNGVRDVAQAPNGESMVEAQARAVHALQRIAVDYPEHEIAVVSHGEIVRSLLLHYLGLPLQAYTRIEVGPASRSLVELAQWGSRVITMNEHSA